MRRQKKFYAWGYADEDLSPEEIKPWEAELAARYHAPAESDRGPSTVTLNWVTITRDA